jgi:hypothetical protein
MPHSYAEAQRITDNAIRRMVNSNSERQIGEEIGYAKGVLDVLEGMGRITKEQSIDLKLRLKKVVVSKQLGLPLEGIAG